MEVAKADEHAQESVSEPNAQVGIGGSDVGVDSEALGHGAGPLAELEEGNVGGLVDSRWVQRVQEREGSVEAAAERHAADNRVRVGVGIERRDFLGCIDGEVWVGGGLGTEEAAEALSGGFVGGGGEEREETGGGPFGGNRDCH